jgi:hypothetical protein
MYKNKPKPETNQAILARIKKEMDEPFMAESTGEEGVDKVTPRELERLPQSPSYQAFATKGREKQ